MSENSNKLIALVFNDPYKADEARAALLRMCGEGLLEIDETAVIAKSGDGKVRISQDTNIVENTKHLGHVAGLIAAAITGTMPFILAGTIGGALLGRLRDHGITNKFLKSLREELQPDTSVLVVVARSDAERRKQVIMRLGVFGQKVLESDLPGEVEAQLNEAFQAEEKKSATTV